MRRLPILFVLIILALAGFYFLNLKKPPETSQIINLNDEYSLHLQPIFNNKCIACHSCYNSPCQLNLTSYEGLTRGASTINLYDFPKLEARKPTRLYVDASSPKEWHGKMGFHSVLEGKGPLSLLEYMIAVPSGVESGKQKKYDSEYSRSCIASTEKNSIKKFIELNPAGRMPLGFPGLLASEKKVIQDWLKKGAHGPNTVDSERTILNHSNFKIKVKEWEEFFNQQGLKEQLVSRYLYEHLFLASIYFSDNPDIFFHLVRSTSADGDIHEIPTSLPFDDPGKTFFYRLRPITNTIVHKSHIPFLFSNERRTKWTKDFLEATWASTPQKMPPYGRLGSNPFTTFAAIPVKARYQFFLDNSGYHIMTFIKGPVCRGPTALNVINDHFWVLFMDPSADVMVNSPSTYKKIADEIEFPSLIGDDFSPLVGFRDRYWKSIDSKFKDLEKKSLSINSLWGGDKKDPNATITVYRHYDSASVLQGLRGRMPKTVWVLDYQVFESIYYNLSAGYNVFAPVLHQINSRLYMEVSRVASEDLFISFLPKEVRPDLRKSWNLSIPKKKQSTLSWLAGLFSLDVEKKLSTEYVFAGGEVQSEVVLKKEHAKEDFLEQLKTEKYTKEQYSPILDHNELLSELSKVPAATVQFLPDTILLKIEDGKSQELWTLIHNEAHFNVAMLLFEDERRRPEKDTLDVIRNPATSYTNLIVVLQKDKIPEFIEDLKKSKSQKMVLSFLKKYGLSRSNPEFWKHYDDISKLSFEKVTNERGYLDLNRYMNF